MAAKQEATEYPITDPQSFRVAYHAGPEEIGFFGRTWHRGVALEVTVNELTGMQARGDYNEFNFKQE